MLYPLWSNRPPGNLFRCINLALYLSNPVRFGKSAYFFVFIRVDSWLTFEQPGSKSLFRNKSNIEERNHV